MKIAYLGNHGPSHSTAEFPRNPGRYVYGLVDPRTNQIRYIGKVKGYLNTRLRGHLREARSKPDINHRLQWIRGLQKQGLEPSLVCLEICRDGDELVEAEKRWIAQAREDGIPLVNMTDGGEGMENPSEETRAKLQARPRPIVTPEIRRARSEAMKRHWADPEFRAKQEQARLRLYGPPKIKMQGEELRLFRIETAKRMGALNRGKAKSEGHRQKLAEATRKYFAEHEHPFQGRKHSEETRSKLRAAWQRRKGVMP